MMRKDQRQASDDDLQPWERRPDEGTAAWAAFCCYRDLGRRRTLDAVDHALYGGGAPVQRPTSAGPAGPSVKKRRRGHLSDWSRRHDWVARAAAWDAEIDQQARLAQVEAVIAMNKRHAQEARALQAKALEALRALAAQGLEPGDIVRYLAEGSKLERLALGQVTDAVRQEQSGSSKVILEVVEKIVPVRGEAGTQAVCPLPPATGGADAPDSTAEVIDQYFDTDTDADFDLPGEAPAPGRG